MTVKNDIVLWDNGTDKFCLFSIPNEAQYAQGAKDFISKFEIALKEASETGYWIELLYRTRYIDEQTFKSLSSKCTSLRVMLIASCKTAKEKVNDCKK